MDKVKTLFFFIQIIGYLAFSQNKKHSDEQAQLANEYYLQGDTQKSYELFEKLAKDKSNIPLIHANYFALLLKESKFDEGEKYIVRAIKSYPSEIQYQIDLLYLYHYSQNDQAKADILKQLIENYQSNHYQLSILAQQMSSRQMIVEAIFTLDYARRISGNPSLYALELASLYRASNNKVAMIKEYVNFSMVNPGNTNYIKNLFQSLLTEEGDLDLLQQQLLERIQTEPQNIVFPELLIWVEIQRKDFYGAFIQARSIDKRTGKTGDESMKVAEIAMDNKAWDEAIQIYEYVIRTFGESYHYGTARQKLIVCKEETIKNKYPIDTTKIRTLTLDYYQLYKELYGSPVSLEALRNKAILHAFYLEEMDSAIALLNYLIDNPKSNRNLLSQCKIDLGDIYLFTANPWEASLLYSQVEKANKYAETGYDAKLKNAKLHYLTGNFELAKSHLNVLKKSTTKRIANDALDLEVFISNSTAFDSTNQVLEQYAKAELLYFQNKKLLAKKELEGLIMDNPTHPVTDDAMWLIAKSSISTGNFVEAVSYLEQITAQFKDGVLADDAAFLKAELFEKNLNQRETAMELYRSFITDFPASVYVAESRKRFRILRGDLIN